MRFVNEGAADRFGTICKNRSFIKEKGFHHPDDFFRKTIAAKGWRALCQPPHPAAMSVVREFYANLASHVVKKVRVRGVLVDFSAESINHYYNLDHFPSEQFDRLYEHPDYPEVIRVLTNGRGECRPSILSLRTCIYHMGVILTHCSHITPFRYQLGWSFSEPRVGLYMVH